ncbi:unnamed protein product [Heligmosomoides polygyrus]|uniref:Methyltransferase FkbM domain-containing protein n=1 Tax=Heligmosomoides polygyrus TaxID=6339 RepID=A0A3P8BD53_HELPZ|nr:unnamed protein product [Heligmosomoides polygyrus]
MNTLVDVSLCISLLPSESSFYGADPIVENNERLYSKFGTFFPFAVGNKSGILDASVYVNRKYISQKAIHVELVYFLTEIIRQKVYDHAIIDAEGTEYGILPYFYRGGQFDQNDITFCQFNIEIHMPDDRKKEMFREFIFTLLRESRYVMLRAIRVDHYRMYFLNFANPYCVSRYVLEIDD